MLLKMAFQNILRNRKRTIITLTAVFFGVFLTIVANGFNKGLEWQIKNLYTKTDTSDFKIVAHNYVIDELKNPIQYPIKDDVALTRILMGDRIVKSFSPRISFYGSLSNGIDEIRSLGIGVDPVLEDAVFHRSRSIVSGRFLKRYEEGIVIGEQLAKLLNLGVGDTITLIAQATEMGTNAYDIVIKGLIRTGNPLIDGGAFFIPDGLARNFLSIRGVTDIAVAVNQKASIQQMEATIGRQVSGEKIKILSWRDYAKDYIPLIEMRKKMIGVLTGMILLIAAAGIMNTMLMAMMERKWEIGNLMAMGVRPLEILNLFLQEGMIIGFLGSLIGVIIGSAIVYYFQFNGIAVNGLSDVAVAGKLYTYVDIGQVITSFFMGLIVATLSTVYPAVKSASMHPVEAIQGRRG